MIRIGHAPRLPRRQRIARVLNQLGGYALAWGLFAWGCYWLADVRMAVPLWMFAAMIANPWRSKKSRRRFVDAVLAACRGSVAGASSGPGAPPLRRPVASPRARAA